MHSTENAEKYTDAEKAIMAEVAAMVRSYWLGEPLTE